MTTFATLIANPSVGPNLARVPNGLVPGKPEPTQVEPGWHLVADDLAAVRADHVERYRHHQQHIGAKASSIATPRPLQRAVAAAQFVRQRGQPFVERPQRGRGAQQGRGQQARIHRAVDARQSAWPAANTLARAAFLDRKSVV